MSLSTRNHRATGLGTDRQAAKYPWHVLSAAGKLLVASPTREAAEKLAAAITRAEPVRVVRRGES